MTYRPAPIGEPSAPMVKPLAWKAAVTAAVVYIAVPVPYNALADVTFPTWPADQIPDWLAAIPLTKPGSRPDASKPM